METSKILPRWSSRSWGLHKPLSEGPFVYLISSAGELWHSEGRDSVPNNTPGTETVGGQPLLVTSE